MLASGMTAHSYARILGANDRIRLGQLGCGDRSEGHVHMVQLASKQIPVETVAVCDLWNRARERRAAQVKKAFNLEPQTYQYSEDMLARKDIDGVMIATGDFQHAKLCSEVVRAGKDCYVEKPFANVLAEAKEARDYCEGVHASCADGDAAPQPGLSAGRAGDYSFGENRRHHAHRAGMERQRGALAFCAGRYRYLSGDVARFEDGMEELALRTKVTTPRRRYRLETLAAGQTRSTIRSSRLS